MHGGGRSATTTLNGSGSDDLDGQIWSYDWDVDGTWRAEGQIVNNVSVDLGEHTVSLTVTDNEDATGTDGAQITVADNLPPTGSITFPTPDTCFGPGAIPVTIQDNFTDDCDPKITKSYSPAPPYKTTKNYVVSVVATDSSNNSTTANATFTIDLEKPTVTPAPYLPDLVLGSAIPFQDFFQTSDEDGARGGVLHEAVYLDNCLVFDGTTYGNHDGLLTDENLTFDMPTFMRCHRGV